MTEIRSLVRHLKNIAHFALANIAIIYYGNPSKRLKIIGVTGTDGKTTTSNYIYQILTLTGKRATLISTIGFFMDGKKSLLGSHVTTPSPFALNKYLKMAVDANVEYVVLEVSSHAIDQHRIFGIKFDVGILTNVTKEHLDYHKNIENYLNTKIKLLTASSNVVLNSEDPFLHKIKSKVINRNILTYSLENNLSDLKYKDIKNEATEELTDYNKKNLMAALLAVRILDKNINLKINFKMLELPEGRLQYLKKTPYSVIIDFAHTPNAFESLLPDLRSKTKGKLIHVFGSAGKRDKSKRPDMGRSSSKYSDVIILTAEDTRGENLHKINSDIRAGMEKDFSLISMQDISKKNLVKSVIQIDDRKKAIEFAIKSAQANDCVLITGKGPEDSMNMGKGEIPWNDIDIALKFLN